MGAVDTMEDFFEKLNEGDRQGAVALMDERVEMRIHVGDNARTLRGVEQVGGWFLRAEPDLKMIPGGVMDLGLTYQADVLSRRSASKPGRSPLSTSRRGKPVRSACAALPELGPPVPSSLRGHSLPG